MKFKRRYTFLYMPDDHGASRQMHVPRWGIVTAAAVALVTCGLAVLYAAGIPLGANWRPGGAPLVRENRELRLRIDELEQQVDRLRTEIAGVYEVQNLVAATMDLPLVDEQTFAAGVGGRRTASDLLVSDGGPEAVGFGTVRSDPTSESLAQLVRQARIQRQGYLAMLDTLEARAEVRAHIPSIRPLDVGWLSSGFGFRDDPFTTKQTFHRGLDFSTPVGTPVRVTGDGRVLAVQRQRGLGRVIKIDHGNNVVTVYAHLDATLVRKGEKVQRGQVIARSGSSGRSTAPHLHYEIRVGGRPVNPASYILDSYANR